MFVRRSTAIVALLLGSLVLASPATPHLFDQEDDYYRAYTLEHEEGALEEALALYERIVADDRAGADLRAKAEHRAQFVAEELASADFSALMPSNALVYLELNRPGEQLSRLLEQLGLLGGWAEMVERGADSFAVSRELVEGAIGVRGCAMALTGVPLDGGTPPGVAILHAGDQRVVRGLVETGLTAGRAVEPIGGFPTWNVEEEGLVTLTSRLVIASHERQQIADVLRRIRGGREDSLSRDAVMAENLAHRADDLFFFCVNAVPVRSMISDMLTAQAAQDPQVAMAAAMLDVESFEAIVARGGMGPDGASMDVVLRLDEGHRNLVFNLMRPAPIDVRSLELVPAGAAGFFSMAFNERGPAIAPLHTNPDGEPVVTAMDMGRELFANLVGVTLFALPPDGRGHGPIPDVACVLSTNDPARSRALWNLGLGLVNLASGAGMQAARDEIGGRQADRYELPDGLPFYVVTDDTELIVSPSKAAIERALTARRTGKAVASDPAFAKGMARIDGGTSQIALIHLGRAAGTARAFLPPGESAEMEPFTAVLDRTVVELSARHSAHELGFSMAVRGMPDVSGLVARMMTEGERAYSPGVADAAERPLEVVKAKAVPAGGDVQRAFERLATDEASEDAARALGADLLALLKDDARALNNLAWALLTEERFGKRFDDLALRLSEASNQATAFGVWQYLDTLALAKFRSGDVQAAIDLQTKALAAIGDEEGRDEVEATLARYRAAHEELASTGAQGG